MRHVAIFRNDFEALNGFSIADYVVEVDRAVFLDPEGSELVKCSSIYSEGGVKWGGCGDITTEGRMKRHWDWY